MPERLERDVKVRLPDAAKEIYKEMEREMVAALEDKTIDAVNAAVLTNKLLQMASGAVYDETGAVAELHSAKLDALEDLIESANGKPVLIYYNYKHERMRIKRRFKDAVEIKTPEDFQAWNKGEIPIAMAHPASMGHGLNLQHGGSTAIWMSLPWSLELYQQANARPVAARTKRYGCDFQAYRRRNNRPGCGTRLGKERCHAGGLNAGGKSEGLS